MLYSTCHFSMSDQSQAQQGLLSPLIMLSPFPQLWFRQIVDRDSENLVNPFMRVFNQKTRHLATFNKYRPLFIAFSSINFKNFLFQKNFNGHRYLYNAGAPVSIMVIYTHGFSTYLKQTYKQNILSPPTPYRALQRSISIIIDKDSPRD